jgi:hypothetical protein
LAITIGNSKYAFLQFKYNSCKSNICANVFINIFFSKLFKISERIPVTINSVSKFIWGILKIGFGLGLGLGLG